MSTRHPVTPVKFFINTHKGATVLAMLVLILIYRQWDNLTAWTYLVLHGTYGVLWVVKSHVFPDKRFERPAALYQGLGVWGLLTTYWVAGYLVISRGSAAPLWLLILITILFAVGQTLHLGSDLQKYRALARRPGELITSGFFSHTRNPNYFGELLTFVSFALLAMHWLPFAILGGWIGIFWIPSMILKDRSLSRYPEFQAYRARSTLFIPFVM